MSGGIHFGAGHSQQNLLYSDPPYAGDGADLYIKKLLAPVTEGEPPGGDKLALTKGESGLGSHETGHKLNTVMKWAGIAFAAVLGVLGLRYMFGFGKAAEAAAKVATKVVSK